MKCRTCKYYGQGDMICHRTNAKEQGKFVYHNKSCNLYKPILALVDFRRPDTYTKYIKEVREGIDNQ